MKKYIVLLSALTALMTACSEKKPTPGYTPDFLSKDGILFSDRMEESPFIWNGKLSIMISARELNKIEIYTDGELVSELNTDFKFGSAIVESGTLYVFGTVKNETIQMISSTDLINWTSPVSVIDQISGQAYFNSSIAKKEDGTFVMVYETCEPGTVCFNGRFAESADLIHWHKKDVIFKPQSYAACPTIRFVNGMYYVFYLKQVGEYFATYLTRSADLINWQDSDQVVISSRLHEGDEGINNSDMDLVEFNGKLFINYADGDQIKWSNIRQSHFDGTLTEFLNRFF